MALDRLSGKIDSDGSQVHVEFAFFDPQVYGGAAKRSAVTHPHLRQNDTTMKGSGHSNEFVDTCGDENPHKKRGGIDKANSVLCQSKRHEQQLHNSGRGRGKAVKRRGYMDSRRRKRLLGRLAPLLPQPCCVKTLTLVCLWLFRYGLCNGFYRSFRFRCLGSPYVYCRS